MASTEGFFHKNTLNEFISHQNRRHGMAAVFVIFGRKITGGIWRGARIFRLNYGKIFQKDLFAALCPVFGLAGPAVTDDGSGWLSPDRL